MQRTTHKVIASTSSVRNMTFGLGISISFALPGLGYPFKFRVLFIAGLLEFVGC